MEKSRICPKCKCENSSNSLYCSQCSTPLTQEAKIKKLGWWLVFYDASLPGWGHYAAGFRKTGLILMGIFLISFTLSALDSAERTMKIMGDLTSNGNISVNSITEGIKNSSTLWSAFLSWTYILTWIGTFINSVRIKINGVK